MSRRIEFASGSKEDIKWPQVGFWMLILHCCGCRLAVIKALTR